MLDRNLIAERLDLIMQAVSRLRKLGRMTGEEFSRNEDAIDVAENRLRRALEALFDLGRHIAVKTGAGIPADYRSVITLLQEKEVFPAQFAESIKGMAGYPNRLIHEYNKVTPQELYQIITTRLDDLEKFCWYIVEFVKKATDSQSR
ncbi:MAG: DUF86 domain-containing protein [Clostridia bacterium]|nr:MAG: DUF86 domain-containing protein [Clostridia bacterium]